MLQFETLMIFTKKYPLKTTFILLVHNILWTTCRWSGLLFGGACFQRWTEEHNFVLSYIWVYNFLTRVSNWQGGLVTYYGMKIT